MIVKRFMTPVVLAILMGVSFGCDTDTKGSLKVKGGNHQKISYEVGGSFGVRFLAPGGSHPEYTLIVEGYPYNRLLLKATMVPNISVDALVVAGTTTSTVTGTPMTLTAGTLIPMVVTVGSDVFSYTAALSTISSLPLGTYLIDAPGLVQDVQASLEVNPGTAVQLYLPGVGSGAEKPLASAGSVYLDGDIGSTNITLDMAPDQATYWSGLQTTRVPKPGVITPTW